MAILHASESARSYTREVRPGSFGSPPDLKGDLSATPCQPASSYLRPPTSEPLRFPFYHPFNPCKRSPLSTHAYQKCITMCAGFLVPYFSATYRLRHVTNAKPTLDPRRNQPSTNFSQSSWSSARRANNRPQAITIFYPEGGKLTHTIRHVEFGYPRHPSQGSSSDAFPGQRSCTLPTRPRQAANNRLSEVHIK